MDKRKIYPHQKKAIDEIAKSISRGHKKIALQLMTGAGKSFIAKTIIVSSLMKGKKVAFVTRGNLLMNQIIKDFQDIDHGLIWADKTHKVWKDFIVVSAPSYISKRSFYKEVFVKKDLVIIDEAHDCTSDGYKKLLNDINKEAFCIGLSATFYQKSDGSGHSYWQDFVCPISGYELQEIGILPNRETYSIDWNIDYSKVKTTAGDYNTTDLYNQVKSKEKTLYGNMIKNYNLYNPKKKPTIAFCINIKHALEVASNFEREGIKSLLIHSKLDLEKKKQFKKNLRYYLDNNIPFIISSVDMLSRGVDIPELEVGLMMRPTKSKLLFFQQIGRLTRKKNKNKEETVIILDFTGNTTKWDNYAYHSPDAIDEIRRSKKKSQVKEKFITCHKCGTINNYNSIYCSFCKSYLKIATVIEYKDSELKKVNYKFVEKDLKNKIKQLNYVKEKYQLADSYVWNSIIKSFGNDIFVNCPDIPIEERIKIKEKGLIF